MSRIIRLTMVLATPFALAAFAVACAGMEVTTPTATAAPGPTPTPTISPAGVAASRIATLTAFTNSKQFRVVALTAESEAIAAEAILKNAPEDEKAKWEATATSTRLIADAAIATAIAATRRIEPPEFVATEVAEWAIKNATQEADDDLYRRRRENCQRAAEIRSDVAAAEKWYARRDVSVGELSVFRPAEATARAAALRRASELCR